MKPFIVLLFSMAISAIGQTNQPTVRTADPITNSGHFIFTNLVHAPAFIRDVGGQMYDIRRSILWHNLSGKIIGKTAAGIVIQTYITNLTYRLIGANVTPGESVGMGAPGPLSGPSKRLEHVEVFPDKPITIRNCHTGYVGQFITIRAMMISGMGQMETWDCGLPHYATIVVTNQIHSGIGSNGTAIQP